MSAPSNADALGEKHEAETFRKKTHPFAVGMWTVLGLLALTFAGGVLRFWMLDFGLPNDSRPDEIPNIQVAMTLLSHLMGATSGDLNPKVFNYGSLYYYLLLVCYWVYFSVGQFAGRWFQFQEMAQFYLMDPTGFHVIIRGISAVSGTLMIPLMFFTARLWAGERVAWLAAVMMTVSYLMVRNAHFGAPDMLMTLGILASVLTLLMYQKSGLRRDLKISGVLIGLSVAIKIPAILMAFPLAWACLAPHIQQGRIHWRAAWPDFSQGMTWLFGALLLGFPWLILDMPGILQWFAYESAFYTYNLPGIPIGWEFYSLFTLPVGLGFLTLAAAIWGGILLSREKDAKQSALNGTLWFSLLAFALFLGPNTRVMTRYALPLVPFILLFAAFGSAWLLDRLQALRLFQKEQATWTLYGVLFLLLLAEPLRMSILWDRLLAAGDTRTIAAQWLLANTPPQTPVATGPRLGHLFLPAQYGQLLLETGPNNLSPPQQVKFEAVDPRTRLTNHYDFEQLRQFGIRYVVAYADDLLFSTPEWELKSYLQQAPIVFQVRPQFPKLENRLGQPPKTVYDPMDALFIPYTGLEDMALTGPSILIFDLAQKPPAEIKK